MSKYPYPDDSSISSDWNSTFKLLSTDYFDRWLDTIKCPIKITEELSSIAKDYVMGNFYIEWKPTAQDTPQHIINIVESGTASEESCIKLWDYTFEKLELIGVAEPLYSWGNEIFTLKNIFNARLNSLISALDIWAKNSNGFEIVDLPLSDARKVTVLKALLRASINILSIRIDTEELEKNLWKNLFYGASKEWERLMFRGGVERLLIRINRMHSFIPSFKLILCDLTDEELKALDDWYFQMIKNAHLEDEVKEQNLDISISKLARELCKIDLSNHK